MLQFVPKQSGFTMLELLVTLAIVAILSMIAAPNMSDWMQRNEVRAETQKMLAVINTARSEAITKALVVTVAANPNGNGSVDYDIFSDAGGEGNEAFNAGDGDLYVKQNIPGESNNITITANVNTPGFLSFDPRGRLIPLADADIRLVNDNNTVGRRIDINPMGRVSVSEIDPGAAGGS